jgi:hypothetical protein
MKLGVFTVVLGMTMQRKHTRMVFAFLHSVKAQKMLLSICLNQVFDTSCRNVIGTGGFPKRYCPCQP